MARKKSVKQLKVKLWTLCKLLIRRRHGNTCYTCGAANLSGSNWHTGHFIPSSAGGVLLRYNLENLRPQCYNCNINLGGNGAEYYRRMVAEKGETFVDNLFTLKHSLIKADWVWFEEQIANYKQLYDTEVHIQPGL